MPGIAKDSEVAFSVSWECDKIPAISQHVVYILMHFILDSLANSKGVYCQTPGGGACLSQLLGGGGGISASED